MLPYVNCLSHLNSDLPGSYCDEWFMIVYWRFCLLSKEKKTSIICIHLHYRKKSFSLFSPQIFAGILNVYSIPHLILEHLVVLFWSSWVVWCYCLFTGSAWEAKCFPAITGCFLGGRPGLQSDRGFLSQMPAGLNLPTSLRKSTGCVLVVAGSLVEVPLGIHDMFKGKVRGPKEQRFHRSLLPVTWHSYGVKGVSSLQGLRGTKARVRWYGGIPLMGATQPLCTHALGRKVSDAVRKESPCSGPEHAILFS